MSTQIEPTYSRMTDLTEELEDIKLPSDITDVFLIIHHHIQRAGSGSKHMQGLRIARELLSGSSSQDDCPATSLSNAVLTSLNRERQ